MDKEAKEKAISIIKNYIDGYKLNNQGDLAVPILEEHKSKLNNSKELQRFYFVNFIGIFRDAMIEIENEGEEE